MTSGWSVRRFGVALLVMVPLTCSWALGIGRYGGPDEPAHVLRSYAAAHGDLLGESAAPLPPGYRYVIVPASLATGDPSCYRHDPTITSACADGGDGDDGHTSVGAATSAGLTPPLYHLAVGWLVRLGGDPADTTSYRLVAALLHAAVLASIVARAGAHRPAPMWAVVAAVVAITPAAWFLFGVVNPNSLEVALALLAWTGVALLSARSAAGGQGVAPSDVWWIGVPLGLAVAVRPIAVVLAAATVAVALCSVAVLRRSRASVTVLVAPAVLAAAAQLVWVAVVDVELDDPRTAVHQSVLASLGDALGSLRTTAGEAVGALGWNEFRAPSWVMAAWALATVVCVGSMVGRVGRVGRAGVAVMAVWVGALVATPVVFEVVFAGSVGPIWQGRYSLPILVGVVTVFLAARRTVSGDRIDSSSPGVLTGLIAATAVVEVVTYWATVRRYAVGTAGSWWLDGAVSSTVWLSPRAWVVAHLVMVTAIATTGAVAVRRCSRTRR